MRVTVLASGSKGNCTYIEDNNTRILIDVGMSSSYIEDKLKEIDVNPKEIDGILITHTHGDHTAGLSSFNRKYHTQIFISPKMENDLKVYIRNPNFSYLKKEMNIKDIPIKVIKTSHDVESYGYIIGDKLVYITDTGYVNEKYFDMISNKDLYIFESNHDIEMLMNGSYPYHLKKRILGDKGHLSNKDSSYYLSKIIGSNTKYIILAHLSEENNTKEKALETFLSHDSNKEIKTVIIADQKERTELIEV
jgi:phosphoribosyl 1,2-cyclic phosphodiesterase